MSAALTCWNAPLLQAVKAVVSVWSSLQGNSFACWAGAPEVEPIAITIKTGFYPLLTNL